MNRTGWAAGCALLLVVSSPPADAGTPKLSYSIAKQASAQFYGRGCTATSSLRVQELGSSGVNRLRARWELRGTYDTGFLPTYGKTGYAYSPTFPDDARSFYSILSLGTGALNFRRGSSYALWAKMVGERPSFWKPDVVVKGRLGVVGCPQEDVDVQVDGGTPPVFTGGELPGTPQGASVGGGG